MMRKIGKGLKRAAAWYFNQCAQLYDERYLRYANLSF